MHKTLVLSLVIAFLAITVVPAQSFAYSVSTKAGDLIAGGGNVAGAKDVGDVYIWNDAVNIYVEYKIINPPGEVWYLTESHVEVKTSPTLIPQKNGNPIPGKFTYKSTHNYITEYLYTIPKGGLSGTVYIAVHGVVGRPGGLQSFEIGLPSTVQMTLLTAPYVGGPSYFPEVKISNGGMLDGTYKGWCADTEHSIFSTLIYTADVYSSYSTTLPAGIVDKPENLDLINWIINENFVGKTGPNGVYTYGDVQLAIWTLIDNNVLYSDPNLGPYNMNRVNEILDGALTNGEGYKPGSGGKLAVILKPQPLVIGPCTLISQVIIIEVPIPCIAYESETCWGAVKIYENDILVGFNHPFPGKNWATYLIYNIT